MAERGLALAADDLLDRDPPRDDRQVRRQRTVPLETPEDAVVPLDDPEQDLGADVLDVGLRERHAPGVRHVLDDVVDQPHIPIDELDPGTRFTFQAAVEELTIVVAEGHVRISRWIVGARRSGRPTPPAGLAAAPRFGTRRTIERS